MVLHFYFKSLSLQEYSKIQVSINEWMDEQGMEHHSLLKRKEILMRAATWMELEDMELAAIIKEGQILWISNYSAT